MPVENYLNLFEAAIAKQAELVGQSKAWAQAKKAGLSISCEGHIVACAGNPMVVLLKLIRYFTEDGNIAALEACDPLIQRLTDISVELERVGG